MQGRGRNGCWQGRPALTSRMPPGVQAWPLGSGQLPQLRPPLAAVTCEALGSERAHLLCYQSWQKGSLSCSSSAADTQETGEPAL